MYQGAPWVPQDPYAAAYMQQAPPQPGAEDQSVTDPSGKCQRKEPPCKYLHPPQHLKEQLLQNGRQNLAIKYHWSQIMAAQNQAAYAQLQNPLMHGVQGVGLPGVPTMAPQYLYGAQMGLPQMGVGGLPLHLQTQGLDAQAAYSQIPVTSTAGTGGVGQQKAPRADRLEVCPDYSKDASCTHDDECEKAHPPDYVLTEDDLAVVCMDFVKGKCTREHCKYYHPTPKLLNKVNQNRAALAAANQANTQAAQALTQALSQAALAAALHPAATQQQQLLMTSQAGSQMAGLAASALPVYSQAASMSQVTPGLQSPYAVAQPGSFTQVQAAQAAQAQAVAHAVAAQTNAVGVGGSVATSADALNPQAKKRTREEELLLSSVGGIPVKRQAIDNKGLPVYQPGAYQQFAYQSGQPAYLPAASFYGAYDMTQHTPTYLVAGHASGVQRL